MSFFSVKLLQRGKLNGKVTPKTPELRVEVRRIGDQPGATITPAPGVSGAWSRVGKQLNGTVRLLDILYRFLSARGKILADKKARADVAPAVTMQADNAQPVTTAATVTAQPAMEVSADARPVVSVFARVTAYARAAASYIANILTGHAAGAIAAPGAVVEYSGGMALTRTSRAEAVGSVCTESRNVQAAGTDATAGTAQGVSTAAAVAFVADNAVQAIAAPTEAVAVQSTPALSAAATIVYAWSVEFRTHAGVLLYSCLVNNGANCPDPVAAGLLAEPTRESDAQYHYTAYTGWSRTLNGDADTTALQNITGPVTVYPAFEKELRYYDISFYDGEELLKTEPWAYGSTPSNTPEKSGYQFVGWTPEIVPVTGPAAYGAIWITDYLASGSCGDGVTYVLTKTGDLVISGTGAMADYAAASEQPWYAYASEIKTITVEDGVTHIGSQSFRATNVAGVTIPNSVTSIGKSAFYANSLLTSITVPASVAEMGAYVFGGCTALTSVELEDGITLLGASMFNGCTSLTSITIPDSVVTIGSYAFANCTSLGVNQKLSGSGSALYLTVDDVILGNGVELIDYYAFYGCTSLKGINIPKSVKTINYRAFQGCSALQYLWIGAGVTTIGDYTFYNTNLKNVVWRATISNWYRCSSSTATSGTRIYPGNYTYAGLCSQLTSTASGGWCKYWLKVIE